MKKRIERSYEGLTAKIKKLEKMLLKKHFPEKDVQAVMEILNKKFNIK